MSCQLVKTGKQTIVCCPYCSLGRHNCAYNHPLFLQNSGVVFHTSQENPPSCSTESKPSTVHQTGAKKIPYWRTTKVMCIVIFVFVVTYVPYIVVSFACPKSFWLTDIASVLWTINTFVNPRIQEQGVQESIQDSASSSALQLILKPTRPAGKISERYTVSFDLFWIFAPFQFQIHSCLNVQFILQQSGSGLGLYI